MAFKQYNPQSSPFANRRPTGADSIMAGMNDLAGSLLGIKQAKDAEKAKAAKEAYDKVQADRQAKDDLYKDYLRQFEVAGAERQAAAMQPTLPGSNEPMPGMTGPPTAEEQAARPTPGQFQNITTPSGETMQLPPLQSRTELSQAAQAAQAAEDERKLEFKKRENALEPPKPPTTKNINGREMGWNPATSRFDIDFGRSGKPEESGGGGPASTDAWVDAVGRGQSTLIGVPKEERTAVVNAMKVAGVAIPNKDALGAADALSGARDSVAELRRQITAIQSEQDPATRAELVLRFNAQASALTANIGRALGNKGQFSDKDRDAYQAALTTPLVATMANTDWASRRLAGFEETLGNLTAASRKRWSEKLGGGKLLFWPEGEARVEAPGSAPTAGTGPKIGERRTIKGQPAEWDGKGWLPVRQ